MQFGNEVRNALVTENEPPGRITGVHNPDLLRLIQSGHFTVLRSFWHPCFAGSAFPTFAPALSRLKRRRIVKQGGTLGNQPISRARSPIAVLLAMSVVGTNAKCDHVRYVAALEA
jgi:hypothetical protein